MRPPPADPEELPVSLYDLLSEREREWFDAKQRFPVLGTVGEDGRPASR